MENKSITEHIHQEFLHILDGAPAHCTAEVSSELYRMFDDRWFRRLGTLNFPLKFPDITPLDFYQWGTLKEKVYRSSIKTREELENRVRFRCRYVLLNQAELMKTN